MVPTVPCLFVIERRTDTWRPLVTGLVPASYASERAARADAAYMTAQLGWTLRVVRTGA